MTNADTKPDLDHTTPPSGRDTTISPNNHSKDIICKSASVKGIKMNYLHVPQSYNPRVYELNDDIILQYETEMSSDDEVKGVKSEHIKVV